MNEHSALQLDFRTRSAKFFLQGVASQKSIFEFNDRSRKLMKVTDHLY